jgi:hypothetical protein
MFSFISIESPVLSAQRLAPTCWILTIQQKNLIFGFGGCALGDAAWTDNWVVLYCRGGYYLKVYRDPSPEKEAKPTLQDMLDLSHAPDGVLSQ